MEEYQRVKMLIEYYKALSTRHCQLQEKGYYTEAAKINGTIVNVRTEIESLLLTNVK